MSRIKNLLTASWKGVEFSITDELITKSGRRIILHDYPNSNTRYVEDQGELPPSFKIKAFVHGIDWREKSDKLETALKSEGVGKLVMPTFGILQVYALPYTKNASQKSVGEISFDLEFVAGKSISGPSITQPTVRTVYANGTKLIDEVGGALEEKHIPPVSTSNVKNAIFDLNQCANALNIITTTVNNSYDVETAIRLINANAPKIVRSGESMKTAFMGDLWSKVSEGLADGKGLKQMLDLTKFGAELTLSLSDINNAYHNAEAIPGDYDIPLWIGITANQITRNLNRLNTLNSQRVAALGCAYMQTADTTYQTDVELKDARVAVETEYKMLMIDDTENPDIIQSSPAVRQAVDDLRLSALNVLDQKEQTLFIVTTVDNLVPASAFVESYQLYAEEFKTSEDATNRAIVIRDLNPTMPADKLSGEVTVLQK